MINLEVNLVDPAWNATAATQNAGTFTPFGSIVYDNAFRGGLGNAVEVRNRSKLNQAHGCRITRANRVPQDKLPPRRLKRRPPRR